MARGPQNRPIPRDLLARQPWGELLQRLTAMAAIRLRGRPDDAQQLALDAVRQFLEPESTVVWDYDLEPSPARCLGSILNGLIRNFVRVHRNTAEIPMPHETLESGSDPNALNPEQHAARREFVSIVLDRVVALSPGDEVVCRLVDLCRTGVVESDEQEVALGVSRGVLYEARRRFRERLQRARQEQEDQRQ